MFLVRLAASFGVVGGLLVFVWVVAVAWYSVNFFVGLGCVLLFFG